MPLDPRDAKQRFAGVDGCRGGWFAVVLDLDRGDREVQLTGSLLPEFSSVLALRPRPRFLAVDMPIGLPATRAVGGRECDQLARQRLGCRRSSVFSPPGRDLLGARSWSEARGRGISIQAFHLIPKMREVDALMTNSRQRWVREAHPELAFARLLGEPMRSPKRTPEGRQQRLALLQHLHSGATRLFESALAAHPRAALAPDDVLDAMVLALVARDMAAGRALCLPKRAARDPRGLRMQIWG